MPFKSQPPNERARIPGPVLRRSFELLGFVVLWSKISPSSHSPNILLPHYPTSCLFFRVFLFRLACSRVSSHPIIRRSSHSFSYGIHPPHPSFSLHEAPHISHSYSTLCHEAELPVFQSAGSVLLCERDDRSFIDRMGIDVSLFRLSAPSTYPTLP